MLLTLNLAKCEFAKAVVTYLGKKVCQGCVRPVTAKVAAVVEFSTPITKRQLSPDFRNGRVLLWIL